MSKQQEKPIDWVGNTLAWLFLAFVGYAVSNSHSKPEFNYVTEDGTGYVVTQKLKGSTARDVISAIKSGRYKTLYLDSNGGYVHQAFEIGEALRESDMNVMIGEGMKCKSACFFIWMMGAKGKKILHNKALIGIHAPATNGVPYRKLVGEERAEADGIKRRLKTIAREIGMETRFIDRMFSVKNETMEYLDYRDLNQYFPSKRGGK